MRDDVTDVLLFAVLVAAAAIWTVGVSTAQNESIDRAHAAMHGRR